MLRFSEKLFAIISFLPYFAYSKLKRKKKKGKSARLSKLFKEKGRKSMFRIGSRDQGGKLCFPWAHMVTTVGLRGRP